MRRASIFPILLMLLSAQAPLRATDLARERVPFDGGWRFHLGDPSGYTGAPEITHWRWRSASEGVLGNAPAAPSFPVTGPLWRDASPGEDVFHQKSGVAWFRLELPASDAASQAVSFRSVDDTAAVFLNGRKLTYHEGWNDPFTVDLTKAWNPQGPNILAVRVFNGAQGGGIGEAHFIAAGKDVPLRAWRVYLAPDGLTQGPDRTGLQEDPSSPAWADASMGEDVFGGVRGYAWFKADLPSIPQSGRTLCFDAVDDNATVYLNGKKLFHHEGWNESFAVPLDKVWNARGPNHLAVLVENTYGGGAIQRTTLTFDGLRPSGPALPSFDDAAWRPVHLPHDFVVEGAFDPAADKSHGYLPTGVGWYRKTFTLSASDKGRALWIDFDGAYRDARVWLNGNLLGRHASGYTSFRYDITDQAVFGGENVLVVRCDATVPEGWWYEGGGLYRHVWLHKAPPLHVAPWGVFVNAQPSEEIDPDSAAVTVTTRLDNLNGSSGPCRLVSEILDPSGKSVLTLSTDGKIRESGHQVFVQTGRLDHPALWSLEKPNLYRLVSRVEQEGAEIDRVETAFGVRTFRFDKDRGFFLNGKSVKIQGTCNHQDFAGVGIAMGDRLQAYRIERLRSLGCNAIRCSHQPMAAELLDECDRVGLLVMDENRRLGDSPETLSQVRDMVLRDRNHPSVFLWSLCNEESLQGTEEGAKKGRIMKDLILSLDPTRLVTCAMNGGFGEGLSKVVDLQGFNYHVTEYEPFHAAHPETPLFGSETASTVGTRGVYRSDPSRGYVTSYDLVAPEWAQTTEVAWKALAEKPYMAGGFVWTGFDYRGEPTPYGWPCISSHFGILDTCGFPKDNAWYYQSVWGKESVLHLLPHWNAPPAGEDGKVPVWAYTNCEEVELFLNGRSLGREKVPALGHAEWKVTYRPGTLVARGYRSGFSVIEDKVSTTGQPAALLLGPYVTRLQANGEDQVPVAVTVVDARGRVVPTASNRVIFHVKGPAIVDGVGNGDPSCHEPDKASGRSAFNGRCMVILRSGERAGRVVLTATSPGLKSASVTLQTVTP